LGFSQNQELEKPNYKQIEKLISDENSNFLYSKLLEKFNASDTTLTLQEKRLLYYGFTFQKQYSPYEKSKFNDSLKVVFSKNNFTESDFKSVVKYSDSVLVDFPFNLDVLNYKLFAFKNLQNKNEFVNTLNQMKMIIDAILSSGDGLTDKNAIYVINVSHEYFILNVLGLTFGGEQRLINQCDYLVVGENSNGIDGLYFNISPSLNALEKLLK
jgi:hypothetical protein